MQIYFSPKFMAHPRFASQSSYPITDNGVTYPQKLRPLFPKAEPAHSEAELLPYRPAILHWLAHCRIRPDAHNNISMAAGAQYFFNRKAPIEKQPGRIQFFLNAVAHNDGHISLDDLAEFDYHVDHQDPKTAADYVVNEEEFRQALDLAYKHYLRSESEKTALTPSQRQSLEDRLAQNHFTYSRTELDETTDLLQTNERNLKAIGAAQNYDKTMAMVPEMVQKAQARDLLYRDFFETGNFPQAQSYHPKTNAFHWLQWLITRITPRNSDTQYTLTKREKLSILNHTEHPSTPRIQTKRKFIRIPFKLPPNNNNDAALQVIDAGSQKLIETLKLPKTQRFLQALYTQYEELWQNPQKLKAIVGPLCKILQEGFSLENPLPTKFPQKTSATHQAFLKKVTFDIENPSFQLIVGAFQRTSICFYPQHLQTFYRFYRDTQKSSRYAPRQKDWLANLLRNDLLETVFEETTHAYQYSLIEPTIQAMFSNPHQGRYTIAGKFALRIKDYLENMLNGYTIGKKDAIIHGYQENYEEQPIEHDAKAIVKAGMNYVSKSVFSKR